MMERKRDVLEIVVPQVSHWRVYLVNQCSCVPKQWITDGILEYSLPKPEKIFFENRKFKEHFLRGTFLVWMSTHHIVQTAVFFKTCTVPTNFWLTCDFLFICANEEDVFENKRFVGAQKVGCL